MKCTNCGREFKNVNGITDVTNFALYGNLCIKCSKDAELLSTNIDCAQKAVLMRVSKKIGFNDLLMKELYSLHKNHIGMKLCRVLTSNTWISLLYSMTYRGKHAELTIETKTEYDGYNPEYILEVIEYKTSTNELHIRVKRIFRDGKVLSNTSVVDEFK